MFKRVLAAATVAMAVSVAGSAFAGSCNSFKPGTWDATWDNGRAVTLVIESVDGCSATVTYYWSVYKSESAGSYSTQAASGDGKLVVPLAFDTLRASLVLRPSGDDLKGTWARADGTGEIKTRFKPSAG